MKEKPSEIIRRRLDRAVGVPQVINVAVDEILIALDDMDARIRNLEAPPQ
jgi:hypothetical protein